MNHIQLKKGIPRESEIDAVGISIYEHFGTRPGEGLSTQNFLGVAENQGLRINDLLDGLRYGEENGWFEDGANGQVLLTAAGFAEI